MPLSVKERIASLEKGNKEEMPSNTTFSKTNILGIKKGQESLHIKSLTKSSARSETSLETRSPPESPRSPLKASIEIEKSTLSENSEESSPCTMGTNKSALKDRIASFEQGGPTQKDRITSYEGGKSTKKQDSPNTSLPQKQFVAMTSSASRNTSTSVDMSPSSVEDNAQSKKEKSPKHRPLEVTCRIQKDSERESTGLSFVSYHSKQGIYIAHIKKGSKAEQTELKEGMCLTHLNGQPCPERARDVIQIVKAGNLDLEISAIDGNFEEEASTSDGSEEEDSTTSREERDEMESLDEIISINVQQPSMGLVDKFFLNLGCIDMDEIEEHFLDDDDVTVRDDEEIPSEESVTTETPAEDSVTATPLEENKPRNDPEKEVPRPKSFVNSRKIIHADVTKTSTKDKLGLSFVTFKSKRGVYIHKIHDKSKCQGTGLEPGMKVLYINGDPAPHRVSELLKLIKTVRGDLIISAISISNTKKSTSNDKGAAPSWRSARVGAT